MADADARPLLREAAQKDMDQLRTLAPDAETLFVKLLCARRLWRSRWNWIAR